MIVVDTNVIAYLYLPGDFTAAAEGWLEQDAEWAAPLLWRSEMRNILAGYLHRGSLTLAQCQAIQAEAEDVMHGMEHAVNSAAVLQLAQASGCSAYDCEFVVLAMQLGVPLVTADKQVLRAFPAVAVPLVQPA